MCQLLKQMLPPVGLGLKCPKIVAYKVCDNFFFFLKPSHVLLTVSLLKVIKFLPTSFFSFHFVQRLVKMNMTLYKDGTVDYTGTFFALVRSGLNIYTENGKSVRVNQQNNKQRV